MEIFKKLSMASYILVFSALIALIAMVVGIVSCSGEGFWEDEMGAVIALTIIGIVLVAATIFCGIKFGNKVWLSLIMLLIVLFFALATCNMIIGKMDVMGTVVFSDLEKGFKPAEDACYIGLASSIIYIVASLIAVIGTFFNVVRKSES